MKSLIWLYASVFIDLFGASLVVLMLGPHLRSLGLMPSVIGLMGSMYAGIQLLSGPIIGSWSDNYGRKRILTVTLLICSLSYFVLGCVSTFIFLLSVRIVLGLMKHTQTICKAVVADLIPVEQQAETHGKLSAVASLGFMIGPVVGGHIGELENGFQYICIITSVLFLFNSFVVHLYFPEVKKNSKHNITLKSSLKGIAQNLIDVDWKQFWDIFLLKFIAGLCMSIFFTNYYLFVSKSYEVTPKYIGYTVSFQGLVSASSGMQIGLFNKLYSKNSSYYTRLYHCFMILSIAFLGISLSPNLTVFVICLLPLSASCALLRTYSTDISLERASKNNRGSLMGASNSVSSSARLVAPILTGCFQEHLNTSSIMMFAFILSCLGTCLSAFLNMSHSKLNKKID